MRPGDTVDKIAAATGADPEALLTVNQLEYPYRLAVGQALLLYPASGTGRAAQIEKNSGRLPVISAGYAYPYISEWVLEETLPYLTQLNVFSYGFTADGKLIAPAADDQPLVRAALTHGVKPLLTLTPLTDDGHFNNHLVSALVRNPSARLTLLRGLTGVLAQKGYAGVNIDFEYVPAEDREAFTEFVAYTAELLNRFEYEVSAALVPKTADGQPGLLYEGMDYAGLGAAANRVLLMTYEWGYTYGPPMAVAPLNQVRRVVEYALSRIPAEKILLGIPNYGYDWPLPFISGSTRAETLGNVQAVQRAIMHGTEIHYDETGQSPYFHYWQYGVRQEVWFEDVRSYDAKFRLAEEYGLRGVFFWQLMRLFRAGLELFRGYFR